MVVMVMMMVVVEVGGVGGVGCDDGCGGGCCGCGGCGGGQYENHTPVLVPVPTAQEYDAKTTLWWVIGTDTTIQKKQAFYLIIFF